MTLRHQRAETLRKMRHSITKSHSDMADHQTASVLASLDGAVFALEPEACRHVSKVGMYCVLERLYGKEYCPEHIIFHKGVEPE